MIRKGNKRFNKIFGIGANKTGTKSLAKALDLLGFRCSHWEHHGEMSRQYVNNQFRFDFLQRYDAIADLPVPSLYTELDREYPDSKFILTVRDLQSWIDSEKVHHSKLEGPIFEVFLMYGSWYFDQDMFISRYQEHCRRVIEYFKNRKEDLLVMDICGGDGWQKLCPFLEIDEPEVSFPHFNKASH